MTKKPVVYLGGPIEGVTKETWQWRNLLKQDELLAEIIEFRDPTLRKAFHSQEYSSNLSKKIMKVDLWDIDNSDILFCNLLDRGEGKAWGSVSEIMYAWTKGKIIITILESEFKHPFIESCSTLLVHTVEDAIKELKGIVAW